MNTLIYCFGRAFIALVQLLPLNLVARLGRAGGGLAFRLDGRHRRVVLDNLTLCFGKEKSAEEIHALAQENFRRIGENYLSAVKTSTMTAAELKPHVEFAGEERLPHKTGGEPLRNVVVAVGHFGNFELFARFHDRRPDFQCVTTYRALNQPALNRLMQLLRVKSGCLYLERRADGPLLRAAMNRGGVILGLFADQSSKGVRAPFLGHDCNTGLASAVVALRYEAILYTAACYRVGPAKWRLELGDLIATHQDGHPRPSAEIILDVNRSLETAVRRDPANWFWVHRRWKD
jgi:Kdo2-lipid IVA lauroyltransferase/acyltransferase